MAFKLGRWYESKRQVRSKYAEYWKGILMRGADLAIIFNYQGARRTHYGDCVDLPNESVEYIGEGLRGDQSLNSRNKALVDSKSSGQELRLFLDCGDLFTPKKLLYAGKWFVDDWTYEPLSGRKVYRFRLRTRQEGVLPFLRYTFFESKHPEFERTLQVFARHRSAFYQEYSDILRVKDNISGEIGEYFAVKALNACERNPVIRLSSGVKNIDAVQIGNGRTYAIKTISSIPASTSNIWAGRPEEAVDDFVVVLLNHELLSPVCVLRMSAKRAKRFLWKDRYQGSFKLKVTREFAETANLLMGDLPE